MYQPCRGPPPTCSSRAPARPSSTRPNKCCNRYMLVSCASHLPGSSAVRPPAHRSQWHAHTGIPQCIHVMWASAHIRRARYLNCVRGGGAFRLSTLHAAEHVGTWRQQLIYSMRAVDTSNAYRNTQPCWGDPRKQLAHMDTCEPQTR